MVDTTIRPEDLRADDPETRSAAGRALGSIPSETRGAKGREHLDKLRKEGIKGGRKPGSSLSEEHKRKISEGAKRRAEERAAAKAQAGKTVR